MRARRACQARAKADSSVTRPPGGPAREDTSIEASSFADESRVLAARAMEAQRNAMSAIEETRLQPPPGGPVREGTSSEATGSSLTGANELRATCQLMEFPPTRLMEFLGDETVVATVQQLQSDTEDVGLTSGRRLAALEALQEQIDRAHNVLPPRTAARSVMQRFDGISSLVSGQVAGRAEEEGHRFAAGLLPAMAGVTVDGCWLPPAGQALQKPPTLVFGICRSCDDLGGLLARTLSKQVAETMHTTDSVEPVMLHLNQMEGSLLTSRGCSCWELQMAQAKTTAALFAAWPSGGHLTWDFVVTMTATMFQDLIQGRTVLLRTRFDAGIIVPSLDVAFVNFCIQHGICSHNPDIRRL